MDHYTWVDPPQGSAYPVDRAGIPFIGAGVFLTLVAALLGWPVLAVLFLLATGCIVFFFRDPNRPVPVDQSLVVSPADGRVIRVGPVEENPFVDGPRLCISIFMSVANVHVNRAPVSGKVKRILYKPGEFMVASHDAARHRNEHNAVVIQTADFDLAVVQVAGLVARRIICRARPGDELGRGEKFGIICFGSRLDLYLPPEITPTVRVGEHVRSGMTGVGRLP